jgi:hypothetical protein
MGMNVDQPRRYQPTLGADRAARVRGRQRRRDRADLTSGDADVHQAAQPAARIEHVAASKQKVVFHRPPSFPLGCVSSAIGALLATLPRLCRTLIRISLGGLARSLSAHRLSRVRRCTRPALEGADGSRLRN